jgi:hypothetical protein
MKWTSILAIMLLFWVMSALTQILERVENNVDWKKRDEKKIENFFKTRLF